MPLSAGTFTGKEVVDVLRKLLLIRGTPRHIRWDDGVRFIANAVRSWLEKNDISPLWIEPGVPWESGGGENFNGKLCDELLNGELFTSLVGARVVLGDHRGHHNHRRPHSSLGYMTTAAFASACRQAPPLGLASLALAPPHACTRYESAPDPPDVCRHSARQRAEYFLC